MNASSVAWEQELERWLAGGGNDGADAPPPKA